MSQRPGNYDPKGRPMWAPGTSPSNPYGGGAQPDIYQRPMGQPYNPSWGGASSGWQPAPWMEQPDWSAQPTWGQTSDLPGGAVYNPGYAGPADTSNPWNTGSGQVGYPPGFGYQPPAGGNIQQAQYPAFGTASGTYAGWQGYQPTTLNALSAQPRAQGYGSTYQPMW